MQDQNLITTQGRTCANTRNC